MGILQSGVNGALVLHLVVMAWKQELEIVQTQLQLMVVKPAQEKAMRQGSACLHNVLMVSPLVIKGSKVSPSFLS